MKTRGSVPPKFVTPSVPELLTDKERARGCQPNVRLDPHERAMVEHYDEGNDRQPTALLGLAEPVLVAVFYLGMLIVTGSIIGHLFGWWRLYWWRLY